MMYGIVFEQAADGGVGAYLPDMPGVAVVGCDEADAISMLDQAVRWHVDGMIEDGDPLPDPTADLSRYAWLIVLDRTFVERMAPGLRGTVVTTSNSATPIAKSFRRAATATPRKIAQQSLAIA